EEQSLSYGELNRRANQLGNYLCARGVGPEVCVGICLERSLELMIAQVAVLKSGGAFVPLAVDYPVSRLSHMVAQSGAKVVVTRQVELTKLQLECVSICLDEESSRIDEFSAQAPVYKAESDHLAYVIFTSGSTGVPKPVAVSHRGLPNLVAVEIEALEIRPGTRALQYSSPSFDAAIWECTPGLAAGGC